MEARLDERLPILEVAGDGMVSKMGDFTVGFEATKPEIFTLSGDNYEALHQAYVRALKVLPAGSVFHMQDWYIKDSYGADYEKAGDSLLSRASERYYNEREFLRHTCRIFLTRRPEGRRMPTSGASGLLRRTLVPTELLSKEAVRDFETAVGQFETIVGDSGMVMLRRLKDKELASGYKKAGVIESYCYLSEGRDEQVIRDIRFEEMIRVGELHAPLFTLADPEFLPAQCAPKVRYERYSTDKTRFPIGFAAGLGQLLYCNHVYNQYVCIEDAQATIKKLESKSRRLQSLSAYSRENVLSREATNAFLNEAISEQRTPVKAHFNVLAWTDREEEVKDIRNWVSAAIASMEAVPHVETIGAPQIWWAGIPGNAGDLPVNETFDTFLEQAACFFHYETAYQDSVSAFGIRLGDRQTGKPVHVDLSDLPMKLSWTTNRNKAIFGPSGSGKSFLTNHMLRSYYEQRTHIVVVDVGHSYKGLCDLIDGYYFTYSETNPLRFNPFYIPPGDTLDTETKESIKTMLLALWKKSDETFSRSEYVALSNALQLFFDRLNHRKDLFPCFDSFYEFLQEEYVEVLSRERVKEKDFDVTNFLYVLRPFYKGGEYDYLLNARENLDLLDTPFIVFELDNIKDSPVLFSVTTIIIMQVFINKMRKLKGIRKLILIEEAWKAIAREGMAEFLKYLFKTVRKFFGEAIVVTQEIDDILSSPIVKQAVLLNADCKILLDQRKYQNRFDEVQEMLGLSDKERALVLSVNRANDPARKYKEVFINLGSHSKVYRVEVSLEEYLTYTTEESEKLKVAEYAQRYGSMRKGIEMLAAELREAARVNGWGKF
jgi:conjugation system TraG family ATPase